MFRRLIRASAFFLIVLLTSLALSIPTVQAKEQKPAIRTSLSRLIANPRFYNNKRVIVEGFATVQFEGNALYVSADDYLHRNIKRRVWLRFEYFPKEYDKHLSDVVVEGTFDKNDRGHMGLCEGTIKDITRIEKIKKD